MSQPAGEQDWAETDSWHTGNMLSHSDVWPDIYSTTNMSDTLKGVKKIVVLLSLD